MEEVYSRAYVELYEIIRHMNDNLKSKIPSNILDALLVSKDKNYTFNYDSTLSLDMQNIMSETKSLLSIIYSDYLCSDEERKKWEEYDNYEEEIISIQKQNEENDKVDFKFSPKSILEDNKPSDIIVKKEDSLFKKIMNKILNFFKK